MDSFFFPGGYFVFVVSETGKEPHRFEVFSADPRSEFGINPECEKKGPNVSREKMGNFLGRG